MSPNAFIPPELAIAPNPFGLPRNLKLTTIPIDADTSFELWVPLTATPLLPEEAALLQHDRARLEEIGTRLIWLLNATCIDDQPHSLGQGVSHHQVSSWQDVITVIQQKAMRLDAIEITHLPQTICRVDHSSRRSSSWMIQPNRWQFSFLQLNATGQGFEPETLPVLLLVSLGKPVLKAVEGVAA